MLELAKRSKRQRLKQLNTYQFKEQNMSGGGGAQGIIRVKY
jgi:hypothetical protein